MLKQPGSSTKTQGMSIVLCWLVCTWACASGNRTTRVTNKTPLTSPTFLLLPQDTALFEQIMQKRLEATSYAIHLASKQTIVTNLIFRYWTINHQGQPCRVDEEDFFTHGGQLGQGLLYQKKSLKVFCGTSLVFELMHIEKNGKPADFVIENLGQKIHIRGEKYGQSIERTLSDLPAPFGVSKQKLLSMQVGEEYRNSRFDPDDLKLEQSRHILVNKDDHLLRFQVKERSQQVEVWLDQNARVVKMAGLGQTFLPCSIDQALSERNTG